VDVEVDAQQEVAALCLLEIGMEESVSDDEAQEHHEQEEEQQKTEEVDVDVQQEAAALCLLEVGMEDCTGTGACSGSGTFIMSTQVTTKKEQDKEEEDDEHEEQHQDKDLEAAQEGLLRDMEDAIWKQNKLAHVEAQIKEESACPTATGARGRRNEHKNANTSP
jgi:hypothetical protein